MAFNEETNCEDLRDRDGELAARTFERKPGAGRRRSFKVFGSGVIGIAACQPIAVVYGDTYVSTNLIEEDRKQIKDRELAAAEAEFRTGLQGRISRLEWRSTVTVYSLSRYLARQVRSADLLITGVDRDVSLFDMTRHTDLGDLVMQAGRPVLVVPTAAKVIFDCVLVGWKDARESRLAVLNALPFLAKAAQVTVAEIVAEEDLPEARTDVADVVGWLKLMASRPNLWRSPPRGTTRPS